VKISPEMLKVGRVLHEDDDFVTLEVGKHDDVTFTLEKDEDGETVGGDNFLTVLFVHAEDGAFAVWEPWEDEGE
jgi:hypothetical protein